MDMISANLFRALPPSDYLDFDPDEDEPKMEPAWNHVHIVYEFLLRLITSPHTVQEVFIKVLDKRFIVNLLELFDSQDFREREYLKTILHRTYVAYFELRVVIRQAIQDVLYHYVYVKTKHNGIGELLELYTTIVKGFSSPLNPDHVQFLHKVVLPLHSVPAVKYF